MGLPRPGWSEVYMTVAARRADSDAPSTAAFLQSLVEVEKQVLEEDRSVMTTIHFKPGTLTRSDRTLAKFLDYLRSYPRTHPSAGFIA
jgi:hypothetical protein